MCINILLFYLLIVNLYFILIYNAISYYNNQIYKFKNISTVLPISHSHFHIKQKWTTFSAIYQ